MQKRLLNTQISVYSYLHWLVVNSVNASLHRIDLRNVSDSVNTKLTVQSRIGLTTDLQLESLNLSSALLLDPLTGNLLLSDANSGDIVNCSVVDDTCVTLVSADSWQPQLAAVMAQVAITFHTTLNLYYSST
jgi:hypothetical protein